MGRFQIGSIHTNKHGDEYQIIDVIHRSGKSARYLVEFVSSGYIVERGETELYKGTLFDVTKPSLYGVGYVSHTEYPRCIVRDSTRVNHPCYEVWLGILKRCYAVDSTGYKNYGGKGVTVCDEWLDYTKFYEWFMPRHKQGHCVDKDIMSKGFVGSVYSPETCEIVPNSVNTFLTNSRRKRGLYPVGVYRKNNKNGTVRYIAQVGNLGDRQDYLGRFETMHEAFMAYKTAREALCKELAEREYTLGNISERVYNRLMGWQAVPYP